MAELAQAAEVDGGQLGIVAEQYEMRSGQTRWDGEALQANIVADIDHVDAELDPASFAIGLAGRIFERSAAS